MCVEKPWSEWTESDSKKTKFDWIGKTIITSVLSSYEFFRVSQCKTAKEMWNILEVTLEETNDVKRARKHKKILSHIVNCTALVVGSDDVASSYYIGVLHGTPG